MAASRCSRIPAGPGTSALWILVACRLRSSVMAIRHETGSSPGQRPFVSRNRKRVSIPPVMRQVGSNLRQTSCARRDTCGFYRVRGDERLNARFFVEVRIRRTVVFRTFQNSSLTLRVTSQALSIEAQYLLHLEGSWRASCVTRVCMRVAFNNTNKNRGLCAGAAVANVEVRFLANRKSLPSH